jgi:hypothetical protein
MPLSEIFSATFPGSDTSVGGAGTGTALVYTDSHGGPSGLLIDLAGNDWNVVGHFVNLANFSASYGNGGLLFYNVTLGDGYVEVTTNQMGPTIAGRCDLAARITAGSPANQSTYYMLALSSAGGGGSQIFKIGAGGSPGSPTSQDALPGSGDAIWVDGHVYVIRFAVTGTTSVAFTITITDTNTSAVHTYHGTDTSSTYPSGFFGVINLGGGPGKRASTLAFGATAGITSPTTTLYTNLSPEDVTVNGVGSNFTSGSVVTATGAGTSLHTFTPITTTSATVSINMTPGTSGTCTLTIDGVSMTFAVSNPIPPVPGAYTSAGNVANITGAIVANPTIASPGPFAYAHCRSSSNGTPFLTGDSTTVGTGLTFADAPGDLLPRFYTCRVTDTGTGLFADTFQAAHRIIARFRPGWIGDSLTQHGSLQAPYCRRLRTGFNVDPGNGTDAGLNQGIQATTAQDWALANPNGYLAAALAALHALSVDTINLMLSTNNAVNGDSPSVFIAAYQSVVNSIVASGFRVIMHASPYIVPNASFTIAMSSLIPQYAALLPALADGVNIFMGDRHGGYDYLLDYQLDTFDGVHFTDPAGYDALGDCQADATALALGYSRSGSRRHGLLPRGR